MTDEERNAAAPGPDEDAVLTANALKAMAFPSESC